MTRVPIQLTTNQNFATNVNEEIVVGGVGGGGPAARERLLVFGGESHSRPLAYNNSKLWPSFKPTGKRKMCNQQMKPNANQ